MAGIGKQLDGEKNVSASPHGHYEPGQIFQNLRPDPEPYLSPARVGPGSGLKARPKPGLGLQARPGTSLTATIRTSCFRFRTAAEECFYVGIERSHDGSLEWDVGDTGLFTLTIERRDNFGAMSLEREYSALAVCHSKLRVFDIPVKGPGYLCDECGINGCRYCVV
ncbi:hypothetical protein B0H11DRAFT_1927928 [Mycena galericulata]|nr:hypothetical protein B0H11DRAFT_1927928 [Mycena galericulata]